MSRRRRSVMSEELKTELAKDLGFYETVQQEGWGGIKAKDAKQHGETRHPARRRGCSPQIVRFKTCQTEISMASHGNLRFSIGRGRFEMTCLVQFVIMI